ncbi:MAG: hypothetical protein ACP5M0_09260 [Desulfomonilaceae bacterium]
MDSHLRGNDMQRVNAAIPDHFREWLYVHAYPNGLWRCATCLAVKRQSSLFAPRA